MTNWREWFVPPEDDPHDTEYGRYAALAAVSGSRSETEDKIRPKNRPQPKCVSCKKYMGYSSGMYIMIDDPWRLHISCFNRVVEERFKQGEVIDLTTGVIHQIELEESNEI